MIVNINANNGQGTYPPSSGGANNRSAVAASTRPQVVVNAAGGDRRLDTLENEMIFERRQLNRMNDKVLLLS
jgi:hypothetical protein